MYLARFGYLDPALQNPSSGALISGDSVRRAIIDFQSFAGLNQTGVFIDDAIFELFDHSNCYNLMDISGET